MSKEYTISEFAKLCGDIANRDVSKLCTNVVKEVGKEFLKKVIRETPSHEGGYEFPKELERLGYHKSTTGLKKGWEDNRNFRISKGTRVYTAVITNKAKSRYISGHTGKRRTDYYADYVERDTPIRAGYKPILGKTVGNTTAKGKQFTQKSVEHTESKLNSIVNKEVAKWFNEVF